MIDKVMRYRDDDHLYSISRFATTAELNASVDHADMLFMFRNAKIINNRLYVPIPIVCALLDVSEHTLHCKYQKRGDFPKPEIEKRDYYPFNDVYQYARIHGRAHIL